MNLVFTGFMGSGKTTIGKIAAEKLGRAFFDTDSMIEKSAGLSISGIFASSGEEAFRKIESETVAAAAGMDDIVISCGGGVVTVPKNIEILKKNGIIVNLFASPEVLLERISESGRRPLIAGASNPLGEIKKMLLKRAQSYKNCDFAFDTGGLSPAECAEEILNGLNIACILERGYK